MAFKKGQGGRPKGVKNHAGADVEARCRALIESDAYQTSFQARHAAGTLPPALEAMTWHYAYGKPPEHMQVTGADGGAILVRWKK